MSKLSQKIQEAGDTATRETEFMAFMKRYPLEIITAAQEILLIDELIYDYLQGSGGDVFLDFSRLSDLLGDLDGVAFERLSNGSNVWGYGFGVEEGQEHPQDIADLTYYHNKVIVPLIENGIMKEDDVEKIKNCLQNSTEAFWQALLENDKK